MNRKRETQDRGWASMKRVIYKTFKNWLVDFDHKSNTMTWLDCEMATEGGKRVVEKLNARCAPGLPTESREEKTSLKNGLLELTQCI